MVVENCKKYKYVTVVYEMRFSPVVLLCCIKSLQICCMEERKNKNNNWIHTASWAHLTLCQVLLYHSSELVYNFELFNILFGLHKVRPKFEHSVWHYFCSKLLRKCFVNMQKKKLGSILRFIQQVACIKKKFANWMKCACHFKNYIHDL